MQKVGTRSISPSAQWHLRQLVVKAVLDGKKPKEVAQLLGVTQQTIDKWMKAYRLQGHERSNPNRKAARNEESSSSGRLQRLPSGQRSPSNGLEKEYPHIRRQAQKEKAHYTGTRQWGCVPTVPCGLSAMKYTSSNHGVVAFRLWLAALRLWTSLARQDSSRLWPNLINL